MTVVNNKNKDTIVSLVLDSAPLIKRVNLFPMAQKFYTIPEVIAEIRDKQAREQLENSLVDIQVKVPSEEALNAVIKFAKKTGDLATLSKTDLKVIALTWMLEKEAGNLANIRTEPIKSQVQFGKQKGKKSVEKKEQKPEESKPEAEDENMNEDDIGAFNEQIDWEQEFVEIEDKEFESDYEVDIDANEEENNEQKENEVVEEAQENNENENNEQKENEVVEEAQENNENENEKVEEKEQEKEESKEEVKEEASSSEIKEEKKEDDDDDDDDEGWITPDNINKYHAKAYGWNKKDKSEPKTYDVACMTADFAMQNVLLQMNLKILSVDGMIIKRLKNWVLRCHACY
eukprot:jgi/Orpsp1_1/1176725/evm.model.c7180000058752.2